MGNKKYEEYWENRKKEYASSSGKSSPTISRNEKYASYWAEKFASSLPEKIESLTSASEELSKKYTSRFIDKDGNYIDAYRKDTGDALVSYQASKKKIDKDAQAIAEGISAYEKYLDADTVKSIRDYLSSYSGDLDGMYETYKADHDYLSQFEDEGAYNRNYDHSTYSKKYAKSTYADLQKAKADIEAKLSKNKDDETLNRELYWLQNHDTDVQYVDSMSTEELEQYKKNFEAKSKELETNVKNLKRTKRILESSGATNDNYYTTVCNDLTAAENALNKFKEENSSVLYTDEDGAGITADTLLNMRAAEKKFGIEGIDSAELEKDLEVINRTRLWLANQQSDATQTQLDYENSSPQAKADMEYLKAKYSIDDSALPYDVFEAVKDLEEYANWNVDKSNLAEKQAKDAEYASKHPYLATGKAILSAPLTVFELADNILRDSSLRKDEYGAHNLVNVYDDKHINQNATYTGTVGQNINDYVMDKTNSEILSWLASGAYSGITSSAQSALTTGACTLMFGAAGAPIALGIMGTEAAASSYNSAIMNGSTNGEAILTATASGIAEALFEKVSLDKLLDIGKMYDVSSMSALLKSMIKNSGATFVQGGVEASEEFFTEITNKIADEIINGDHSAYNTAVAKYKKMGYSDADAKDIATQDAIKEVLEALYGGFIGGIGSGAGASLTQGTRATGVAIGNEIRSNNYYNQMGKNIVTNEGVQDLTDKAKGSRELRKLANKVAGVNVVELTDEKGIKKYEKQVGKLYKGVTESQLKNLSKTNASETEVNSFKELVKAELESKGVQNVDKAAEVVVKSALNDGKLTREESIIYNSVNGRQVIHNVLRSEDLQVEEGSALEQAKGEINSTRDLAKFDINKALKRDLLSKTEYDVSSDGTTTIEATGEEVESMVITSLEGADITLDVKSGDNHHTVVAGELRLNQDYAVILEGLKNIKDKVGLDDSTANKILTLWEGYDGDSFTFYKAVESGLLYGQYNMREDFEKNIFAKNLPEDIRNRVFEMGREYKQKVTEEKSASNKKNAIADLESSITYAEGVSYDSLNESQKAQVDFAQVIAKTFGFNLEIFRSPKKNGKSIGENGSYNISTNTMRLDVDAGTLAGKSLILFTQAHELTHYIKKWSPESYKTFADLVVKKYGEKGVSVDNLVQKQIKNSIYSAKADKTGRHHVLSYEEAFDEVVANACEDFLADTNIQQTINEIAKIDQTLAQKIKDFLENIIAKLEEAIKGLQGQSVEATLLRDLDAEDLQELKDLWLAALIDSRENVLQARQNDAKAEKNTTDKGDVKYLLRETTDGRIVAVVDNDILENIDTTSWDNTKKETAKKAASNALKQFNDGIVVDGITRKVNRRSRREYTRSDYTESLYNKTPDVFADKMRAADVADDIVVATTNWNRDGGLKHPRDDNFVDFDHGTTLIATKTAKYSAEVVVGITDNGEAVLYDVVDMKPTTFDIKKEESPTTATTQNAIGDIKGDSSTTILSQNSEKSSEKNDFLLSDSDGRELSTEQSEYFKESKIRDADGNLKVMYHGSPETFTVFDRKKARSGGTYGSGFYFTDSKSHAGTYGDSYVVYLNITNPLQNGTKDITKEQLRKFVEEIAENEDYGIENYGYGATIDSVVDSVYGKSDFGMLLDLNVSCIGDMVEAVKLFNEVNGTDYDGIVAPTETVAFHSNQIKNIDNLNPTENEDIRYSERVTDKETLDFLNEQIENGEYIKVYRSFQVIDGGLYAPMNAVDRDENGKNKKLGYRSEYGVWEKSTESPEIAQKYMDSHPDAPYAKFDLDGVDNKTNGVAYNPYLHASNLVLNDQFSAAYRRNLITVECYVPLSEASGSYKAQYAKDATGWVDWKAGGVAGRLLKIKPELTRRLFVSRYMLPVRQVPDAEVAEMYKEYLDGTDIAVPWNVVTPSLRKELEKVGVGISYNDVKFGTKTISFNDAFPDEDIKYQDRDLNEATFNGKPFWSGSVSLIDGVIEEVHSIEEAEAVDFHHSLYFSQAQVEKMEAGENAFFFIDGGKVEGDWRESVPKNIIKKIEEQITFNTDIAYQDRQYQPTLEDLGIDFKEENERLKADVDRLQEVLKLQGTVTHGKALATKAYEGVAKKLLHNFGMKRVTDANLLDSLVKRLDKFYYSIIEADELAWETVFNDAMEIAEWLEYQMPVEEFRADYADEILKNIRSIKISLDDAQMAEVAYTYGSYNAFRKSNFGTINLANDGIKLDSQWSEWAKAYPWVFDAETNSADMPVRLVEIINDLRTVYRVSEEYDKTDKLRSMAMDIYDSYWQIPTVRTLADKHQQEVNLLKSKHKTEMDALKERKDTQLKYTKEYYQEMVKKVRADKDAKMEAYKERTQEQRKKNLEGRTKTATKNKIKRVVKQLESLYSNPTKEKNVKIEFQDMVKKALVMADAIFDSSNISSYDILSGDITTTLTEKEKQSIEKWREIQKAREGYQQRLDVLEASENVNPKTHEELLKMISECNKKLNNISRSLSDVVERQRSELNDHSVQDAIDSLVEAYRSLEDSTEGYAKAAYNEYVATRLETLKKSLKNTTAKTMTLTQLDELYQAYKMVLSSVRTANELFVKNKRLSVVDAGESVIREVQKVAKITENKIAKLEELRSFSWQELKPVYAFERIGSETFMDMYKEVLRGQGIFARDIEDSKNFFHDKGKAYGYDSWDSKERKDFKLADGRIFSLSLQEIMSIYAYSKREQALDHITDGGFVFDTKEFFTDNREKGLKGKIERQRTTVKAYRLNIGEFQQIINSLTKEQKKFVDDMQDYLSSVMGAKGNEVSRVLYGIDLFKEKFYFPLMSSHDFITQTNNPAGEVALKNTGMAKATVPHAKNPIVLKGFMDVWSEHVNKMSTYHAFVLPIENLNKVFNYTGYATSDDSVSVESILRGAYGQAVNDYIRTFIQDLNGGVKVQGSGNFVMKAINKFKKTAVAASTSVVIQQPTAIVRALAMIDAKYFVHGRDGMKHNEAWAELKKYAPIAIIKEMGGFDVGGGKQVAEYITAKEYKGIKAKGKGLLTDSTYRDESLMWGASKADEFGWITIWSAVKKEIADTTTLKVGSEEFLQACGERFTEVVDYTQVYDSVISRSGFMRNKGEISKMATSFMGEPTTSFNMLYNAVLQAKRGNIGKGEMAKIMGATISSIILASIAKSLIYALRDDDDDESYLEKYFQSLTNSLMDDLFIPNMLPYVSDITSLFSGWDVERTDMAILKDFKDAIDGLDSSEKSLWRKVEDLVGAVAAFGGLPVKNVIRTVREMYNLMANLFDDNTADADDIGDAIVETITGEKSASDVNEALEKGKTDKAKELIKELVDEKVEGGKTEKEAKASIKASVTGYWKALYLQAYRDNDSAEMLRIRRLLQSTGLYDDVVGTCSNWIKGMKDDTEETKYKKW